MRRKYYLNLMFLPVVGSLFMLYLYFKPCFKVGGTVKRLCSILISSTMVDLVVLTILFLGKFGFEWLLSIAGIFCIFNYILLITIACKLAKYPIGRPAKVVITILLISFFSAVGFMASSTWIIDYRIAQAEKELADIYGRPMTGDALKKIYYHGLEPNYKKFEKILQQDPEDIGCFLHLPVIPENLTCFYKSSLTSKKLDKQLTEWIKSEKTFFYDFDKIIKSEKYLKMPGSIRRYDGLLWDLALPELAHQRRWARLTKMRIKDAINRNDTNEALRLFKQLKRIRNYSADGHCLITFLVTMVVESIRFSALEVIVGKGNLTDAQIKELISEIEDNKLKWDELYKMAMYSDAVISLDAFRYFANCMNPTVYLHETDSRLPEYLSKDGYIDRNKLLGKFLTAPVYFKYHREILYALVFFKARAKAAPDDWTIWKKLDKIPAQAAFCKLILGNFRGLWSKTESVYNIQSAVVTALRIELYRKKYHKLPDKLSDLVPEFASRVPIDLLSGDPLKYIHGTIMLLLIDARNKYSELDKPVPIKINGYRIYSVGPDGYDNGGFQGVFAKEYCDDIGFSVIQSVAKSDAELSEDSLFNF